MTWWGLAFVLPLAGCLDAEDSGAGEIEVDDNSFRPSTATAKVGETFEFENEGSATHTVTVHRPPAPATEYVFDRELKSGASTSLTFDQPGTYHVFCRFHGSIGSGMHLNVEVSA